MTESPDHTNRGLERTDVPTERDALRSYFDEEDFRIFSALKEDGRMSDTELAERVGLSRTAVRRRRENLLNEGVLEILAVVVLQEANFSYGTVLVRLEPSVNGEQLDAIVELINSSDLVYTFDMVMGEYDLMMHIWHESFPELKTYLWELLDEIGVVDDFQFIPIAKTWKAWNKELDSSR